jgi:hypothetical protein
VSCRVPCWVVAADFSRVSGEINYSNFFRWSATEPGYGLPVFSGRGAAQICSDIMIAAAARLP